MCRVMSLCLVCTTASCAADTSAAQGSEDGGATGALPLAARVARAEAAWRKLEVQVGAKADDMALQGALLQIGELQDKVRGV